MQSIRVSVPLGWSCFSTKTPLSVNYYTDGKYVKFQEDGNKYEIEKEMAKLYFTDYCEYAKTNKPVIFLSIFCQGLGDWIRAASAIRKLKKISGQNIVLVCLDCQIARNFINSQLKNVINRVIWMPPIEPFYNSEPLQTLDWNFSKTTHLMWNLVFEHITSQQNYYLRSSEYVVLRNPNFKLPPYSIRNIFDYRLALYCSEDNTIDYEVGKAADRYADAWWANQGEKSEIKIGVGLRWDANLSSAHRNTELTVINDVIKLINSKYRQGVQIILFGNLPPKGQIVTGPNTIDFCEPWKRGVTIEQQAAVLKRLDGVVGFNSGGLDLPMSCGVAGLRIRAHFPSEFLNDNIVSNLSVNIINDDYKDKAILYQATELFVEGIINSSKSSNDHKIYYVGKNKLYYKQAAVEFKPINIDHLLNGKTPGRAVLHESKDYIKDFDMLLENFRNGSLTILIPRKSDTIMQSYLLAGFGAKYLESYLNGIVTSEVKLPEILNNIAVDEDSINKKILAGYNKYISYKEGVQFENILNNNPKQSDQDYLFK